MLTGALGLATMFEHKPQAVRDILRHQAVIHAHQSVSGISAEVDTVVALAGAEGHVAYDAAVLVIQEHEGRTQPPRHRARRHARRAALCAAGVVAAAFVYLLTS